MRLAVISDIHGNLPALEAVLEDMAKRGVEGAISLGDLVGHGPHPNQVVKRVREAGLSGVAGNYDLAVCLADAEEGAARYLKAPISDAAMRTYLWTRENTTAQSREYLKTLPATLWIEEGDRTFLLVHGSPDAANEYLYPDTPEERLAELFHKTGAEVIIAGHTHLPTARKVGDCVLLNPGSVGRSKDGDPRASYIILDTENGFRAEHVRVTFDVESVAQDCVISGLPEEQAAALRLGL